MKYIVAHTNLEPIYPGYVNFNRQDDGAVAVIVRGDPTTEKGEHLCAFRHQRGEPGRCTPGDERCNNYCNLAPQKGPMANAPLSTTHVRCGETVMLTLSSADFDALISGAVAAQSQPPDQQTPSSAEAVPPAGDVAAEPPTDAASVEA